MTARAATGETVPAQNLLWGPASLDRYIEQGVVLPGGGALNMAFHWSQRDLPFLFLTRIGDDMSHVFTDFFRRHGIAHSPSLVEHGQSASIDITIRADRQPFMDNFVEGVWTDFRLNADEEELLQSAHHIQFHELLLRANVDTQKGFLFMGSPTVLTYYLLPPL